MRTVNLSETRTHLSRLVRVAAEGEPFVIARAGKPLVKAVAFSSPEPHFRIGFMAGEISVPDDFDNMGADEIRTMFSGNS